MSWFKGWPVLFFGIAAVSAGAWLNSGGDAGLITGGICLIGAGISQVIIGD